MKGKIPLHSGKGLREGSRSVADLNPDRFHLGGRVGICREKCSTNNFKARGLPLWKRVMANQMARISLTWSFVKARSFP